MATVLSVLYQAPNIWIVQFMYLLYFIEMFTNTYRCIDISYRTYNQLGKFCYCL